MKNCQQCNNQVADDYRYCSVCGFDFQNVDPTPEAMKVKKMKVQKHQVRRVKQMAAPEPSYLPAQSQTPPTPFPPTMPPSSPTMSPPSPTMSPPPQMIIPEPYPYPPYQQTTQIDHRSQAEADYARGDYYSALDNYKLAILTNPGDFNLIMAKERLLEMLNQKDEAVEALDEALKVQPDNRELWRTKSRLLLMLFHEKGDHHYKKESEIADRAAEELKARLIEKGLCPACNGEGKCQKCHGTGSCHECGGTGVYKGVVKCQFCNGSGKCDRCFGSSSCPDCKGSGKLEISDCQKCQGNGLCGKCHGTGKHLIGHCKECDGTGYCPHCKGKGKIVNLPKTA